MTEILVTEYGEGERTLRFFAAGRDGEESNMSASDKS